MTVHVKRHNRVARQSQTHLRPCFLGSEIGAEYDCQVAQSLVCKQRCELLRLGNISVNPLAVALDACLLGKLAVNLDSAVVYDFAFHYRAFYHQSRAGFNHKRIAVVEPERYVAFDGQRSPRFNRKRALVFDVKILVYNRRQVAFDRVILGRAVYIVPSFVLHCIGALQRLAEVHRQSIYAVSEDERSFKALVDFPIRNTELVGFVLGVGFRLREIRIVQTYQSHTHEISLGHVTAFDITSAYGDFVAVRADDNTALPRAGFAILDGCQHCAVGKSQFRSVVILLHNDNAVSLVGNGPAHKLGALRVHNRALVALDSVDRPVVGGEHNRRPALNRAAVDRQLYAACADSHAVITGYDFTAVYDNRCVVGSNRNASLDVRYACVVQRELCAYRGGIKVNSVVINFAFKSNVFERNLYVCAFYRNKMRVRIYREGYVRRRADNGNGACDFKGSDFKRRADSPLVAVLLLCDGLTEFIRGSNRLCLLQCCHCGFCRFDLCFDNCRDVLGRGKLGFEFRQNVKYCLPVCRGIISLDVALETVFYYVHSLVVDKIKPNNVVLLRVHVERDFLRCRIPEINREIRPAVFDCAHKRAARHNGIEVVVAVARRSACRIVVDVHFHVEQHHAAVVYRNAAGLFGKRFKLCRSGLQRAAGNFDFAHARVDCRKSLDVSAGHGQAALTRHINRNVLRARRGTALDGNICRGSKVVARNCKPGGGDFAAVQGKRTVVINHNTVGVGLDFACVYGRGAAVSQVDAEHGVVLCHVLTFGYDFAAPHFYFRIVGVNGVTHIACAVAPISGVVNLDCAAVYFYNGFVGVRANGYYAGVVGLDFARFGCAAVAKREVRASVDLDHRVGSVRQGQSVTVEVEREVVIYLYVCVVNIRREDYLNIFRLDSRFKRIGVFDFRCVGLNCRHGVDCRFFCARHLARQLGFVNSGNAVVVSLFKSAPILRIVGLIVLVKRRFKLGLGKLFCFGKDLSVGLDCRHIGNSLVSKLFYVGYSARVCNCLNSVFFEVFKRLPIVGVVILRFVTVKCFLDCLCRGGFCFGKQDCVRLDSLHSINSRSKRGLHIFDCLCALDCAHALIIQVLDILVILVIIRNFVTFELPVQLVDCFCLLFFKQRRVAFDGSHRIRRLLQSGVHRLDCSGGIDFGFAVVVSLFKNAPIGCVVGLRIFGFCRIQRCQRGCFCFGKQSCVVFDRRHSGYCRLLCRVDCGNACCSLNFIKPPVVSYCQLRPICGGVVVLVVSLESRLDCSFCFRFCLRQSLDVLGHACSHSVKSRLFCSVDGGNIRRSLDCRKTVVVSRFERCPCLGVIIGLRVSFKCRFERSRRGGLGFRRRFGYCLHSRHGVESRVLGGLNCSFRQGGVDSRKTVVLCLGQLSPIVGGVIVLRICSKAVVQSLLCRGFQSRVYVFFRERAVVYNLVRNDGAGNRTVVFKLFGYDVARLRGLRYDNLRACGVNLFDRAVGNGYFGFRLRLQCGYVHLGVFGGNFHFAAHRNVGMGFDAHCALRKVFHRRADSLLGYEHGCRRAFRQIAYFKPAAFEGEHNVRFGAADFEYALEHKAACGGNYRHRVRACGGGCGQLDVCVPLHVALGHIYIYFLRLDRFAAGKNQRRRAYDKRAAAVGGQRPLDLQPEAVEVYFVGRGNL